MSEPMLDVRHAAAHLGLRPAAFLTLVHDAQILTDVTAATSTFTRRHLDQWLEDNARIQPGEASRT